MTQEPKVTIVVVPRERFSCTQESLESIYQHTEIPFKLVYVDGNSPAKVRSYLQQQAEEKNFQLLRTDYYLTPNQARNLGLSQVTTDYLVFADNDVVVTPGWLKALLQCAEETEATVVGPLMCQEKPLHEIVHFAGGESHILVDKMGRRRLREKMYKQGKKVKDIYNDLKRTPTELAEFHCVLVRRSIFDKVGLLDEAIMNTKEHLDFCMSLREIGEKVYFEPASIVTYVPGPPLEFTDLHFYMLRWSNAWQMASLNRIRQKWDLAEDGYFQAKYKQQGWRRYGTIIYPLARRLSLGVGSDLLARAIARFEHIFNRYLTNRHAHQQRQRLQSLPKSPSQPHVSLQS
ncbi:glycosyltransferase family 2 protein [Oscillatoria salina]|uniref:glycosyltransferase family 2 protein n=1 Tax=Oscillatoria salina TaxID=331517 RepID=UPI0013BBD8BD|nr:glycosyltransferase [Oscillatoria salina]MBZ8180604.1 glycosyltransferase family 2 protein [Oscillatoria salina IIICB1]NET88453.1 glycosyltransferase family 2 protein [Kamptonema sp. SIO1D9]